MCVLPAAPYVRLHTDFMRAVHERTPELPGLPVAFTDETLKTRRLAACGTGSMFWRGITQRGCCGRIVCMATGPTVALSLLCSDPGLRLEPPEKHLALTHQKHGSLSHNCFTCCDGIQTESMV